MKALKKNCTEYLDREMSAEWTNGPDIRWANPIWQILEENPRSVNFDSEENAYKLAYSKSQGEKVVQLAVY